MTDSTGQSVPLTLSGTPHPQIVTPSCFGHWGSSGSSSGEMEADLDHCPGNSLQFRRLFGHAQFQFGEYLYEKYLALNAWAMNPLIGNHK